jgi:hypothetical protein
MTESAVLVEPSAETPTAFVNPPPRNEEPSVLPAPIRKPKKFFASLRFNALRYLAFGGSLSLAWGLIRAAMWVGTGSPQGTFMLVLAGGMLAAAGKTAIDILHWAEQTRQAAHVERLRAVRRVFKRARVVREQAVLDWRRIHTVLVDNLTGQPQEIRLFHDHDETDAQAESLFRKALSEDLWIREEGIDAVRRFKAAIAKLDYNALATEPEFLSAFGSLMDTLRRDLALAATGISLD